MIKTALCWLCSFLLLLSPFSAAENSTLTETNSPGVTRCLVLGYDRFVSMPSLAPCSAHNAAVMTALLTDFVPDPDLVVRRVNSPGTVAGLRQLIRNTFRGFTQADTAYLYLSTHGIVWEEEGETRLVFMLSDGTKEETLTPQALRQMLDEIPGRKVFIVDACHSGAMLPFFSSPDYRVLTSSASEEESYFWRAESDTGEGYFTGALEAALRRSDAGLIDPSGDGFITLTEILSRLSGLYGASAAMGTGDESPLFRLPADASPGEGLRSLTFGKPVREEEALTLPFTFSVSEPTRLEYRVVLKKDGAWDFDHAARVPDQERTGTTRGLLSPGDKERKIRVSPDKLGDEGEALLLVVSLRGLHNQIPVLEGTAMITLDN